MDRLPEKLREGIRKSSTLRLQSNLLRAGVDERTVEAMDRETLMVAWAQLVAEGKDKPVEGAAAAVTEAADQRVLGYDPDLEKEKLNFEREKFEWKMKAKRDELDLERANLKFKETKERDEPTRLKKYADALRGVIPKQTNEPVEVVAFFRNVERLFLDFKVPKELQAAIVRPFLTERAKTLIAKLDPDKASKYEEVRNAVLKEYKISATMYRDKFNEIAKTDDQTFIMVTSNLFALLDGYIEARKIADLDDLRNLLVADRLKTTFSPTLLRHVLSIEAKSDKGWLPAYELAEIADDYVANYTDNHFPKSGSLGLVSKPTSKPTVSFGPKSPQATKQVGGNSESKARGPEPSKSGPVKCFNCGGPHLVRFCDKKRNLADRPNTNRVSRVAGARKSHYGKSPGDTAVNKHCCVKSNENVFADTTVQMYEAGECHNSDIVNDNVCDECAVTELDVIHPLKYVKTAIAVADGELKGESYFRAVDALEDSGAELAVVSASVLQQLDGVVPMGRVLLSGISGTPVECPLVRLEVRMLQGNVGEPIPVEVAPRVVITCAVLDQSLDELVLPIAVIDHLRSVGSVCNECVAEVNPSVDNQSHSESTDGGSVENENEVIRDHVLTVDNDGACNDENDDAVTPCSLNVVTRSGLTTDCNDIMSTNVVNDMENDSDAACDDHMISDDLMDKTVNDDAVDPCDIVDADAVHCETKLAESLQTSLAREALINDQKNDDSLRNCWSLLKRGKGNFCLQDGVLMRDEKILGQNFTQLVVPKSKREQVLEFGHDLAGHMSPKKCSQRIRLSFWWPTIKCDVIGHAKQCKICQMRARKTCWDRVPIRATVRQESSFLHWNYDILGPLSSDKLPYQYCLLLIDSMTRFPMAFAIKAPTAKNVCDCLVQTWSIFGVPRFVSADNATCNVAALTRELMKRFGVSPRFITPHHSEGNAAAERLIGTTKNLIAKVAAEHPKSWHKHLPFIMWALREVPSELTGVPPWVLAMGTLPRGPLAVLRETWTGECDFPLNLGKNPTDYLRELHQNLEIAKRYADSHTQRMQDVYVQRYNQRSKDKQFEVGDQVLILQPDSTASRMFSRWKGPGEVVVKRSPYSYVVELDGSRYRLHANQLRKFHVKVDVVTVDNFGLVGPNCVGLADAVLPDVSSEACFDEVADSSAPCVDGTALKVATCAIIHEEDADFGEIPTCKPPVDTCDSDNLLPSQRIDPKTLSHLSDTDKQLLLTVLDKYSDVFSDKPGLYQGVQHSIPVSPDFRPRRLKEYKIPEKIKPEVMRQIQELLDLGIIQKSNSPMASPLVCILKGPAGRDGVRLAVDFRYLNRYTVSDAYPIPDVQDIVQKIGNSRWLSIADASQGYWQTAIQPEDQWKTGFICDDQLYEWTRTAFGMKSSGQTFCRAIQQVLEPIRDIVGSFVDDMVVHSFEFLKHLEDLDSFLTVIRNSGMTLKLRKCKFALPQIRFCGQIIGSGTRQPDPEKVAAVHAIKVPETKKQVRQIMGFFNYFRDSIPGFAALAQPITDLTKKSKSNKIQWGDTEQRALDKLKSALQVATENVLYIIDQNKDYNLLVDSSNHTVAGALTQFSDEGVEHPVAFFSWKLTKTQQGWSTVEKEAYAALRSLQRVKQWVFGHRITVFSDHNPLTYLTEAAPKSAKLLRWALALQEFDVVFQYRAGKTHVVPDLLTRMCN